MLADIDHERVGRLFRKNAVGERRKSRLVPRSARLDRRTGHVLVNGYGTIQEVLDAYRGKARTQYVIVKIDPSNLLPRRERRRLKVGVG